MAGRVTQAAIETLLEPTSQRVRPTQLAIETVLAPSSQLARISQLALEVVVRDKAVLLGETTDIAVGSNQIVLDTPTNTAEGTVMIAQVGFRGGSARTVTPPSGWNLHDRVDSGTDVGLAVYWRVAEDPEPATHAFSFDVATESGGGISAYPDLSPASPISASSPGTASGPTVQTGSVDVSARNPKLVFLAAGSESSSETAEWTAPDGFGETRDRSSTNGASTDRITVHKADKPNAGAGSTGPVQGAAASGNPKVAILLALRDDTQAGSVTSFFLN